MLGRVGSSVGRLGIISANRGPNFSYTGTNTAFQSALTEAAYTGLVAGFSAPAYPQYCLRGVSYPSVLSVPGATYTRTGNRAGLDAAVVYAANVPRVAPGSGLRVFGSGTNLCRSSDDLQAAWGTASGAVITGKNTATLASTAFSRVESAVDFSTLAGSTNTASAVLSGTGTVQLFIKDFSGSFASSVLSVTLTSTPTRYSVTRTSVNANTVMGVQNASGIAVSDLQIRYCQIEAGTFATDYIPNASPSASASVGADAAGVPFTLPTEYTIIMEWIEPAALPSGNRRIVGYSGSNVQSPCFLPAAFPAQIRAWNGSVSIDGTTGVRAAGSTQRAVYRQTAGNRWLHYNGSQIATDANPMTTTGTCFIGSEDVAGVNALNSGVRIVSIIPRDIGATQANAVSVL